MNLAKYLYILLGSLALLTGITGVFVPGLPTTPFLLLAAWLYLKGSKQLHSRLLQSRLLGEYIREYQKQRGMTLRQKISALGVMWFMILFSVIMLIHDPVIGAVVLAIGVVGTLVMGFWIRTSRKDGA